MDRLPIVLLAGLVWGLLAASWTAMPLVLAIVLLAATSIAYLAY